MGFKRRATTLAGDDAQAMDIDEFWNLIDQAIQLGRPDMQDGYQDRFEARLKALLRTRGPEAIAAFHAHYWERMRESFHRDLWDAADLIALGCSDDWFEYFRGWLISMGREVYEQALNNPDSLAGPLTEQNVDRGDVFFERMLYVADTAYEEMTGAEISLSSWRPYPYPAPGRVYRHGNREMESRFPALWARCGKFWPASK